MFKEREMQAREQHTIQEDAQRDSNSLQVLKDIQVELVKMNGKVDDMHERVLVVELRQRKKGVFGCCTASNE